MDSGEQLHDKPTAVCLVRPDVSGLEAPRHAVETQRHTAKLGYVVLYTVRPPADHPDPVGYALGLAAGLAVVAVVVYDLATVDNMPSRVCEMFDLETVCPPVTWTAEQQEVAGREHAHPGHPLTVDEARRIMRQHIGCRALDCARKASAYTCLVRAGKIVPPAETPRERAAARGVRFPPRSSDPPPLAGPDLSTLLALLDGLAADARSGLAAVRPLSGAGG
ncbi:hypothetical protein [Nocardia sp. BMG51109]|uniref:hypothetical protein n=1 Tax=Nocardia sp. BMG51109 TaxID=1056816 RepID=UPI00046699CB|nr:hypothetical protein [Nocardia sp. BMG51109]